jgi:hemoglobin
MCDITTYGGQRSTFNIQHSTFNACALYCVNFFQKIPKSGSSVQHCRKLSRGQNAPARVNGWSQVSTSTGQMAITPAMVMTSNTIYVPPGGPPQDIAPSREIYHLMGEENIFRMCADFYAEIEHSTIRHLFPSDLPAASQKIAAFLIGLLGGPPLYQQRYGDPMMRARHLKFPIDEAARQEWLRCFKKILAEAPANYRFPGQHLPGFIRFLEGFSAWMVNRAS